MFHKQHPPPGSKPGTLVIDAQAERPVIRVIKYKPDHLEEHKIGEVAELNDLLDENAVCWIDVQGLGDEKILSDLADLFSIHPLALEDIVNVPQRPKVERFEKHTLCITRMSLEGDAGIEPEQVSLFIGSNYVRYLLQTDPEAKILNLDSLTYAGSLENLKDLPDHERHTFLEGDICDQQLVEEILRDHKIDTVIHFAAESHVDRSIEGPGAFVRTNIQGTFSFNWV